MISPRKDPASKIVDDEQLNKLLEQQDRIENLINRVKKARGEVVDDKPKAKEKREYNKSAAGSVRSRRSLSTTEVRVSLVRNRVQPGQ